MLIGEVDASQPTGLTVLLTLLVLIGTFGYLFLEIRKRLRTPRINKSTRPQTALAGNTSYIAQTPIKLEPELPHDNGIIIRSYGKPVQNKQTIEPVVQPVVQKEREPAPVYTPNNQQLVKIIPIPTPAQVQAGQVVPQRKLSATEISLRNIGKYEHLPYWWRGWVDAGNTLPDWWFALLRGLLSDEIPHLMIVGETGSGKTMLALALMMELSYRGRVIVLDPHASPHWGLEAVGLGRNYSAIRMSLRAIKHEMDIRFIDFAKGKKTDEFVPLYVFVDEWPAIKDEMENEAKYFMRKMAREARKVGIHLVVLTQSERVETLGVSGEGDIREAFTQLLLGQKALDSCPNTNWNNYQVSRPLSINFRGTPFPASRNFIPWLVQYQVNQRSNWVIPNLPPPPALTEPDYDDIYHGASQEERSLIQNHIFDSLDNHEPDSNLELEAGELPKVAMPIGLDHLKISQMLSEEPKPSLREIAKRLGYSKDGGGRGAMKVKEMIAQIEKATNRSTVPLLEE